MNKKGVIMIRKVSALKNIFNKNLYDSTALPVRCIGSAVRVSSTQTKDSHLYWHSRLSQSPSVYNQQWASYATLPFNSKRLHTSNSSRINVPKKGRCSSSNWYIQTSYSTDSQSHLNEKFIMEGQTASDVQSGLKSDAINIFNSVIESVTPGTMVERTLKRSGNILNVLEMQYVLKKNVYVVGFGKAVIGMARAVEEVLGKHIVKGVISVPVGIREQFRVLRKESMLPSADSKVKVIEGGQNNLPDQASHRAALEIQSLVEELKETDILIVLISGGGSALLPSPVPPITLSEYQEVSRIMGQAGATINQLNLVRKNIDTMKGGGLAMMAKPAKVVSLILSDIIGDHLDLIASGPTVRDHSTPEQCLYTLDLLQIKDKVPSNVLTYLQECVKKNETKEKNRAGKSAQTAFIGHNPYYTYGSYQQNNQPSIVQPHPYNAQEEMFEHVQNVLMGSNSIALQAAADKCEQLGYFPLILTAELTGEARDVGVNFVKLAKFICESWKKMQLYLPGSKDLTRAERELIEIGYTKDTIKIIQEAVTHANNQSKPLCVVSGGETTVTVSGSGKGGRNQELALSAALAFEDIFLDPALLDDFTIQILSAGTDGQDGPTDAAGAFCDPNMTRQSTEDAEVYLRNNDAYNYFKQFTNGSGLFVTGPTGTNVMDIQILLIRAHPKEHQHLRANGVKTV